MTGTLRCCASMCTVDRLLGTLSGSTSCLHQQHLLLAYVKVGTAERYASSPRLAPASTGAVPLACIQAPRRPPDLTCNAHTPGMTDRAA
jgi:hypothetical protein